MREDRQARMTVIIEPNQRGTWDVIAVRWRGFGIIWASDYLPIMRRRKVLGTFDDMHEAAAIARRMLEAERAK